MYTTELCKTGPINYDNEMTNQDMNHYLSHIHCCDDVITVQCEGSDTEISVVHEMTYNVSSGMLSPTIPCHMEITACLYREPEHYKCAMYSKSKHQLTIRSWRL